jgi:3'-phosphoadenosine 5'-phosphosulfate sulfotransferase (PAPS reductase)/FAD synthetase
MIQHLVSVSGGKDSTSVYLLAMESGRPFRAVFADTGNEHELTLEYIAQLHERTGGPKVETVRADFTADLARHKAFILQKWPEELQTGRPGYWNWRSDLEGPEGDPEGDPPAIGDPWDDARKNVEASNGYWKWKPGQKPLSADEAAEIVALAAEMHEPTGNPYLDLCITKSRFPSRMAQFCTGELKEIPITTQVVGSMLREGPVLQWLGIRADESRNRAKQPRFNHHESGSMIWRPIFRWTVEDVWAQHRKHGLRPNPLYAMGMGRVGCMPCINCRKSELRAIAELFPDHIDRIDRWEKMVAAASKRHSATFFAALTDPSDVDRPGTYSGIRQLVEWSKTARGGRQYGMFFEKQSGGGCSSDLGLCEVSEE